MPPDAPAIPPTGAAEPPTILSLLVRQFRALQEQFPQLELADSRWLTGNDEPVDLEEGIQISYRAETGVGDVRVWVSPRRVKLKARWEDGSGRSQLEDRVLVTLAKRPALGEERFESVADFAAALVALMRRRLREVRISDSARREGPGWPGEIPQVFCTNELNRIGNWTRCAAARTAARPSW